MGLLFRSREFIAAGSTWTKQQIVAEVNDMLDLHHNLPLRVSMITDVQAQDFVNQYYKFLKDCIDRKPEYSCDIEEKIVTDWYMNVSRCFFLDPKISPQGV